MAFHKFETNSGQKVSWFALDKDKFQAIFEDALSEMNLISNKGEKIPMSYHISDSKIDQTKIKVEKVDNSYKDTTCRDMKFEEEIDRKMEIIDDFSQNEPSVDSSSDFRVVGTKDLMGFDSADGDCMRRALTPELNRMHITQSLKRSHSATILVSRTSETPPYLDIPDKSIEELVPVKKEENLDKILVETKKNFISIENILSRGNENIQKKCTHQSFERDGLLDTSHKFYNNVLKPMSVPNSYPMRCGWFGMDKKIFTGIVDTLSQIYFENFTRRELVGLTSPTFDRASDSQPIQCQTTRSTELNGHNSWCSNPLDSKKIPKTNEYFAYSFHSKLLKGRLNFQRSGFLERGRPMKRNAKLNLRTPCSKGKDIKRRGKVLNSSCVSSSTISSPGSDGTLSKKCPNSASNKSSAKESWIRVDKSLVNGMVDFLVGQLYPESDLLQKKVDSKQESKSKSNDSKCLSKSAVDPISGPVGETRSPHKGGRLSNNKVICNPPSKRVSNDHKNYSIGFLSKSETRVQKASEGEAAKKANHSDDECNTSVDNPPQSWKSGIIQRVDMNSKESPKRGFSSYWNPGTTNSLKEAILT